MTVIAIRYNSIGDPLESRNFPDVEQAQAWCEAQQSALVWIDTQLGFQGMTQEQIDTLDGKGEFPPQYFEFHGLDGNGAERELEDTDYSAE